MAEYNRNLWAPWRIEYIRTLADERQAGCFLCNYAAAPDKDGGNGVLWRSDTCLTTFNQFPYSPGHLLVAPLTHAPNLEDLDEAVLTELMRQVRDAKRLLDAVCGPHGYNVGLNLGRCAGAGLPGHLHLHVVPRWEGDTNFIPVLTDTRVISQSIEDLHRLMRETAPNLGLPPLRT